MKVTYTTQDKLQKNIGEFHILTYAEEGFSPLTIYGTHYGLDKVLLMDFADEINRKQEAGSLHPGAPISAVPQALIRGRDDSNALAAEICNFLRSNRTTIHATKILFDFRTPNVPVFIDSAIATAMQIADAAMITEVVVVMPD
jgi:hypothetical protein